MCLHCGALEAYDARRPNGSLRFRDFTLTAGTLFASHKLPLKLSLCPSAYDIYCSVPVPSFVSPQQLPLPTIPRIAVRSPLISRPAVRLNIDQDWLASIVGTCRSGIDEFRIHEFWLRHWHPLITELAQGELELASRFVAAGKANQGGGWARRLVLSV